MSLFISNFISANIRQLTRLINEIKRAKLIQAILQFPSILDPIMGLLHAEMYMQVLLLSSQLVKT